LKRKPQTRRQLSLTYSQHDTPLSHTRCDMQIDGPKSFAAPSQSGSAWSLPERKSPAVVSGVR
jgi:hypothetical protein